MKWNAKEQIWEKESRPPEGKHSPLPWRWEGGRASGYLLLSPQGSFGEVYICGEPKNCTAKADAELICTAVNLHEKLVAALGKYKGLIESEFETFGGIADSMKEEYEEICALLKEARGERR